jgi:exosortase D (VPLPA-CTERM-specific)
LKGYLKSITAIKPVEWFKVAIYGTLLYFAYRSALAYLYAKWHDEDFTYCFMVPLIVLYLVWEKRARLGETPNVPSWSGLIPLSLGIFLYWLGELGGEFTMLFISLWLVIVGLCWLHLGWRKLKIISFPIVFGLASFVPPNAVYLPLTFKLKLISSRIGVALMQLSGMSAYREGNVIDLGFTQLQVVDACSGLRYVIPLFLMGVLLAYYYRAAFWKRLLLIVSTVPVSVVTNSLRIASVGILYQFWGPVVAGGFFHDFSGWFIFMAGLAFLLEEMWVLKKLFREKEDTSGETGGWRRETEFICGESEEEVRVSHLTSRVSPSLLRPYQSIAAIAVLLATLVLANMVDFREKTPLVKSFSSFPLKVGEWRGSRMQMEQKYLDVLNLSDYALVDYKDPQGKEVSFYVAYNASQSKGQATHSPATCLPGSGWDFRESGTVSLPFTTGGEKSVRVSRAFMEKNGARQLVYFWFPQRGRVLTNLYQIKIYNFYDALIRQRTDGALVRLITPVYQDEDAGKAESRLLAFTRGIVPVLDGFLPR